MKLKHAHLTFGIAFTCMPLVAFAQFTLAPLPYATDALEPYIDQKTMEIHHDRHHQAYVDNLNAQVNNFPELANISLEALQGQIPSSTPQCATTGAEITTMPYSGK
jgi:Fe-Mn family superoxide dismutase